MNTVLEAYRQHVEERAALGVPPKPLDDAQTAQLVELLKIHQQAKKRSWLICLKTVFLQVLTKQLT